MMRTVRPGGAGPNPRLRPLKRRKAERVELALQSPQVVPSQRKVVQQVACAGVCLCRQVHQPALGLRAEHLGAEVDQRATHVIERL